jgi:hypothetical protein
MIDFKEDNDFDGLFGDDLPGEDIKNNRIATRFVREDIDASITDLGFLNRSKAHPVHLMDITSKGVLIKSDKKLNINQSLTLKLKFLAGKEFVIKAKVVRVADSANSQYGVKFDRYNNELGDYLLDTQTKLVFK